MSSTTIAETVCLQDVPNIGDQTCTTTFSTGTTTTTGNLVSQTFNDGSWNGTMFPDSSDLDEAHILTGKDGKYAETTLNSIDLMTEEELRQGFISNFNADIRWWNKWESTVTMTQTALSGNGDSTTQTLILTDTTNANYEFNNYGNTLIVAPNNEYTNGSLTARFDFDIDDAAGNWNGGHSGVDVTDPTLNLLYTTLTETSNTFVKFCWEFTPSTCPQAVEDIADTIVDIEGDLENIIYDIETPTLEFDLPIMTYEPELIEVDEPEIEIEILSIEAVDMIPDMETVEILSIPVEMSMVEEVPLEQITTEEIIDAYTTEPNVETQPEIEPTNETIIIEENINEVPEEQIAMVEETTEPIQEQPIEEEIKEEVIEEQSIEEEVVQEEVQEESGGLEKEVKVVEEEESNSEDVVADEPVQETDDTQQEEAIETETQEDNSVDVKIAKIEKYIENNVKNAVQKAEATLTVVSELVSREMKSNQVDISSYDNINQAIFDNRQLPDGNADFFNQVALVGYDKTIYNNQVSLSANDPIVEHTIKLNNARSETNKKFNELRELINERNNI
jgi:outer membrane biosynthesis protein TonB